MGSIRVDSEKIYINGQPQKIMSGAMHYFRIVPEYWEDRLLKIKELGCNCVETYLCWNLHEKKEGEFDFSGWLDFSKYLKMAQDMGLFAIVRPGPFICSEWDFGGMPWWLLKDRNMEVRCAHPLFLKKITPYLEKVCEILRDHLITNGGNVLMVQIENEYGSYGNDKAYLRWLKEFYESHGIDVPLITSDGALEFTLRNGTLDDVLASVNYRWESEVSIKALKTYHGGQPGAVMELWNGKAQQWGDPFIRRDIAEVADSVEKALDNAELLNLYMFHGGTNFGFMNGSVVYGSKFLPQATSYDVDAPLDEYGRKTEKYYAEQEIICRKLGKKVENNAKEPQIMPYENIKFVGKTSLACNPGLVRKTESATVLSMEECDQGYGYIIYSTSFFAGEKGGQLLVPEVHDIAHFYINGKYVKTISRNDAERQVEIEDEGYVDVKIVVENLGRVNFGTPLKDRKGLVGDLELKAAKLGDSKLFGFDIYSLELQELPTEYNKETEINAPSFYKYEFEAEECFDTILRVNGFTRGVAFINGFNLGRHWTIEHSENKLFIPAPLIKKGKNEIVVFDIMENENDKEVLLCAE